MADEQEQLVNQQGQGQGQGLWRGRDLRPVPDPTELTTAALEAGMAALKEIIFTRLDAMDRAIALSSDNAARVPTVVDRQVGQLRELHEAKFDGSNQVLGLVRAVIETRFDGMDKAIKLLQDTADRFPARIDEKIEALRGVHETMFQSIQIQFTERDTRTEQLSLKADTAINAALQAAKEAVSQQNLSFSLAINKLETATDKRFDQVGTLISANSSATESKMTDMKERLDRESGQGMGHASERSDQQGQRSFMVALIGVGIALLSGAIALFAFLQNLHK